jgi:hypothetical protein
MQHQTVHAAPKLARRPPQPPNPRKPGYLTASLAAPDGAGPAARRGRRAQAQVNGRIGGESELFPERPGEPAAKFAVIVPDVLFKAGDGRRQLQVYVVDRSGGGPRLRPVTLSGG